MVQTGRNDGPEGVFPLVLARQEGHRPRTGQEWPGLREGTDRPGRRPLPLGQPAPPRELLPLVADLPADRIRVDGGGHSGACLDADALVLSPGVPIQTPIIQAAIADGVPVIGEIELAYRCATTCPTSPSPAPTARPRRPPWSAKSSTRPGSRPPWAATSAPRCVQPGARAGPACVLEVSSFQLETIHTFQPKVAAFLISPTTTSTATAPARSTWR